MIRRAALSFLAVLAIALPASGQKSPTLAGSWGFVTAELDDTCTISGEMTIKATPSKTGPAFSCTFKAVQACRLGTLKTIHTTQTCVATQIGALVTITSKLDKVLSVEPQALRPGMEKHYAPDNFMVTLNTAGDQMDGKFESMGEALVKFRRQQELVS